MIAAMPEYFNYFTDVWKFGRDDDGTTFRIKFRNTTGDIPNIIARDDNLYGGRIGTKPKIITKEVLKGTNN